MTTSSVQDNIWLHRFAKLVAAATFLLIFIGGLVTSTDSGLAVPDWPTTYGYFMFSFPISQMVGGILYEHGHRMVATVVGFLTVILTIWVWLKEPRKWLRWLAVAALGAVIIQGILGGLTVLFLLPTPISVSHATLAQTFFCLTIAIALFTSKSWKTQRQHIVDSSRPPLKILAYVTTGAIFVQLILGALMRHMKAGLAIPDFPLAFGRIIPPITSDQVAIHFAHRLGALLVTICIAWTVIRIIRQYRHESALVGPALLLAVALVAQITLGAFTIWTEKAVIPTTVHVATGAFILATSVVLSLRTHRLFVQQEQTAASVNQMPPALADTA